MATAGRSHDIVLRNTDGSANEVGLNLFRNSPSLQGGYLSKILPYAPDESNKSPQSQQNSYDDTSPNLDLVHEQTSWHRGLGQAAVRRRGVDDYRYASTTGALSMFEGSLVNGYYEDQVDVIVKNPRFEDAENGADTSWTAANVTLATETTSPRSGEQALKVTVGSGTATVTQRYGGDATLFRSKAITLRAYVKRVSGSGTVRLNLIDSAATTNGSTSEAESYTQIEVSRTVAVGATTIDFQLEFSTQDDVWLIDDVSVLPPGESADFHDDAVTLDDELYIPCGRMVCKWNETDDAFYPVYIDSGYEVKCIAEFDVDGTTPTLFIGFGGNQIYKKSTNGTTWAAPTAASTTEDYADFFAITRDANGDTSLAKSHNTEIRLSAGNVATAAANFGNAIYVGSSDKPVTNLFSANDLLYVGKTDGLYRFDRANSKFVDLEPEGGLFDHLNNYKAAIGRGNKIFAGTGARSFFAVTDQDNKVDWADLSHLVKNQIWEGFSGDVEAITQDKANVWLALNTQLNQQFPYSFPISFDENVGTVARTRLLVLRPDVDPAIGSQESTNLVPHTITTMHATNVQKISRFIQAGNIDSLFAFGKFSNTDSNDDEAKVIRIRIPVDNENPARAISSQRAVRKNSFFASQWIDWFYPDIPKTLTKINLVSRNLGSGQSVLVSYKLDDATPEDTEDWTDLGSITASPTGTISASLTSPVTFRRIRIRLKLITDDITEAIEVFSYTIHAVFNPVEHKQWTIQTKLSDNRNSRRGRRVRRRSTLSSADLANLEALRQEPFCIYEDKDGSTYRVKIRQLTDRWVESDDVGGGGSSRKTQIIHLEMNEVRTS